MKKLVAIMAIFVLAASPVFAAPKAKDHPQQSNAGNRITNEAADAVADILTGEDSKKKTSTSKLPPGLAKKDKTPAGWEKGKKTGWDKNEAPVEDSPIKKFFKNLFKSQQAQP